MGYLGLLGPRTRGSSTSGYHTALLSGISQGGESLRPLGPRSGHF